MVSAIILPLAQYRSFADMNIIAIVGAISILVPVVLILIEIALHGKIQSATTNTWLSDPGFDAAVVACMDVVFAM